MIDITFNPEKKRWDQYVADNMAASFSHLYHWGESLATTYALPIFRLAATKRLTGQPCGILPLILFAPPGKAKRLISLPFTDAAGIAADSRESGGHLLFGALELADRLGAEHVELRQGGIAEYFPHQLKTATTWHHTPYTFKTGLIRTLPTSPDALWRDLSAKVRNQVRKARKCGCVVVAGGTDLLMDFYSVFSENMRDLGSPVHARELFRRLLQGECIHNGIIVIYLENTPAAAGLVVQYNKTLYNPWASSLRRCRPSCPNMLLYWSMLEYAILNHCRLFDFGRSSPDAPTCRFKVQWGARREPLVWHVYSREPRSWDPRSESLEYEEWKRLDLKHSRRDGPAIRRWISL